MESLERPTGKNGRAVEKSQRRTSQGTIRKEEAHHASCPHHLGHYCGASRWDGRHPGRALTLLIICRTHTDWLGYRKLRSRHHLRRTTIDDCTRPGKYWSCRSIRCSICPRCTRNHPSPGRLRGRWCTPCHRYRDFLGRSRTGPDDACLHIGSLRGLHDGCSRRIRRSLQNRAVLNRSNRYVRPVDRNLRSTVPAYFRRCSLPRTGSNVGSVDRRNGNWRRHGRSGRPRNGN